MNISTNVSPLEVCRTVIQAARAEYGAIQQRIERDDSLSQQARADLFADVRRIHTYLDSLEQKLEPIVEPLSSLDKKRLLHMSYQLLRWLDA